MTTISEWAFRECTNLEEVNVGDSVTIINESAFAVCPSLKKVTIGKSVATIRYNAFSGSTSALTEVVFKGKTIEEVQAIVSYPWGITDTSIIKTWNVASQEWVKEQSSTRDSYVTRAELEEAIANFTTKQDVQEATEGLLTREALQDATADFTTRTDVYNTKKELEYSIDTMKTALNPNSFYVSRKEYEAAISKFVTH